MTFEELMSAAKGAGLGIRLKLDELGVPQGQHATGQQGVDWIKNPKSVRDFEQLLGQKLNPSQIEEVNQWTRSIGRKEASNIRTGGSDAGGQVRSDVQDLLNRLPSQDPRLQTDYTWSQMPSDQQNQWMRQIGLAGQAGQTVKINPDTGDWEFTGGTAGEFGLPPTADSGLVAPIAPPIPGIGPITDAGMSRWRERGEQTRREGRGGVEDPYGVYQAMRARNFAFDPRIMSPEAYQHALGRGAQSALGGFYLAGDPSMNFIDFVTDQQRALQDIDLRQRFANVAQFIRDPFQNLTNPYEMALASWFDPTKASTAGNLQAAALAAIGGGRAINPMIQQALSRQYNLMETMDPLGGAGANRAFADWVSGMMNRRPAEFQQVGNNFARDTNQYGNRGQTLYQQQDALGRSVYDRIMESQRQNASMYPSFGGPYSAPTVTDREEFNLLGDMNVAPGSTWRPDANVIDYDKWSFAQRQKNEQDRRSNQAAIAGAQAVADAASQANQKAYNEIQDRNLLDPWRLVGANQYNF